MPPLSSRMRGPIPHSPAEPAPVKTESGGIHPPSSPSSDMSPLPKFPLPCYHPSMKNSLPPLVIPAPFPLSSRMRGPIPHSPAEPAPVKTVAGIHHAKTLFVRPTFLKRNESTPETIILRHEIVSLRLPNRILSTPEISYSSGICSLNRVFVTHSQCTAPSSNAILSIKTNRLEKNAHPSRGPGSD